MIVKFPTLAVRPNYLRRGQYVDGHTHNFDHVTAVVRGSVKVEVVTDAGRIGSKVISAPASGARCPTVEFACFNVPAGWRHKITALTDEAETWCLYVPRDEAGEIVEKFDPAADYEWLCG